MNLVIIKKNMDLSQKTFLVQVNILKKPLVFLFILIVKKKDLNKVYSIINEKI